MELEMMMSDELMSTWTELPFDLLSLILYKVISFSLSDYVRIGAVCLEWRSFFLTENYEHIKLPNKLPVLLLPSTTTTTTTTTHSIESIVEDMANSHHQQQQEEEEQEEGVFNVVSRHDYYNPREIWLGLNHKQRHESTRSFYSILERKVYDFQLPIPSYLNCRGSSHGWLVLVEESCDGTYPVHLLNPFRPDNNNKIHLPPLNSSDPYDRVYHSYFLDRAVLSADPSSSSPILSNPTTTDTDDHDELVVLGLCGSGHLRFCRPGDKEWTPLICEGLDSCILNLTCYRGQFWMILQNGRAVAFDIYPLLPKPNLTTIIDPPLDDDDVSSWPDIRYLVESAGNLFQVRRDVYMSDVVDDYSYSIVGFYVFKLDWVSMKWVKTNSLDGHMFFLGDNASISLPASDYYYFSSGGSCRPNSIYFTDDYEDGYGSRPGTDGPHDMGVFNLDDRSFERFEPYYTVDSRHIMPAPIWIQPML